ncbi:capsid protein [Tulane virus]|uniref:Capsid protein n=1 Tax=Tulane virus TaxID=512169 RepID=B2Y6D0_9CALI|nr:capsid protein [Tulane virus]ACB38132.1 capsid protein [Tulane virus]
MENSKTEQVTGATGITQSTVTAPLPEAVSSLSLAPTVNALDPWVYLNQTEVPGGTFTVSSATQPGSVLLELEISPELNLYTSHLFRMYAGWSGGFSLKLLVAGNAFSAGKLIAAIIPPNIEVPNSAYLLTGFPHEILDFRTADSMEIIAPDIKNIDYHFRGDKLGKLVVMVYSPLRSTSADFEIEIKLTSAPLPDFKFTMLVPPIQNNALPIWSIPQAPPYSMVNPRSPLTPVVELYINSSYATCNHQLGRYTIYQGAIGNSTFNPSGAWTATCTAEAGSVTGNPNWRYALLDLPDNPTFDPTLPPVPRGFCDWGSGVKSGNKQHLVCFTGKKFAGGFQDVDAHMWDYGDNETVGLDNTYQRTIYISDPSLEKDAQYLVIPMGVSGAANDDTVQVAPNCYGSWDYAPTVAPPLGEQFVWFRSQLPASKTTTTSGVNSVPVNVNALMSPDLIRSAYASGFPLGKVALLDYVLFGGSVVRQFKLYPEGYMTANTTGSNTGFIIPADGYFRFNSWVSPSFMISSVVDLNLQTAVVFR